MTINTLDFDYVCGLVGRKTGNIVGKTQTQFVQNRLEPLAVEIGLENIERLIKELRRGDAMLESKVAEALTINETSFFRDMHPFDAMRDSIVREVMEKRASRKSLTIWSAASSTGQEAYSIGIVLREYFPELADWNVKIIGTDICDRVIQKARSATYTQFEVNRGLPARLLVKHFNRKGLEWQLKPEIQKMVEFRKMNLFDTWPIYQKIDLVFIRNVLIYFDVAQKQKLLKRVHQSMANDGCMFLGNGETIVGLNAPFTTKIVGKATCFLPKGN